MIIGLGLSADLYIEDEAYRKIADDNYQMFTTGNAMKSDAIMKSNGELDFTKMDNFLSIVPTDMKIYGHNFIWHTQQKQAYLKSLIAPEVILTVMQMMYATMLSPTTVLKEGIPQAGPDYGENTHMMLFNQGMKAITHFISI